MKILRTLSFVIISFVGINCPTMATTVIDFSTNTHPSAWNVCSAGVPNCVMNGGSFDVNSSLSGIGTPGVWQGIFNFFLPADATNVKLDITKIGADDRVVFGLNNYMDTTNSTHSANENSSIVGADHTISGMSGPGKHDFGDGNNPFNFVGGPNWSSLNPLDVIVTSGFILGGNNQLIAYVNNTNSLDIGAPPKSGGPTEYTVLGTVTFVPEPETFALLVLGLASFALLRTNQRRRSTESV